ncbi:MAG: PKD domain-containing protein, partial [Bacteroidota bacterium]
TSFGAQLKTLNAISGAGNPTIQNENVQKGAAKAGCNPVETVPAGYTSTGQTQTFYGTCCYWVETLYSSTGPVQTNCGGSSYAWCCSNVPEAPSCPSGFASDPCCVHYCDDYDVCSCAPWQCCTSSLVQVWIVTESADYTPITITADIINETCPGANNGSLSIIVANGTSPYTYNWSGGQHTQIISGLSAGTYSVTVTDVHNCVAIGTYTVTSGAMPVVSISPDQTVCAGTSVNISAAGGNVYLWNTGDATAFISVTPLTTTSYQVTVTNSQGCSNVAQTVVNVNPLPLVNIVSTSGTVCTGFSATLTATSNHTGTQYLWNTGWTGNMMIVTPPASSLYRVTGTDPNGCVNSEQSYVAVLPNPIVTNVSPGVVICQGDPATLSVSSNIPGSIFIWSNNMNTSSITVSPPASTLYTVTGTAPNGCSSTSAVMVNVNPLPDIQIQSTSLSLCSGTSATLMASGNGAIGSYLWSNNQSGQIMIVAPTANTVYSVTGTDLNGCSAAVSVAITVNPNPVVSLNAMNQQMCDGNTATLNAFSNDPSTQYLWSNGSSSSSIQVMPHNTSTYTVTGTNANGCSTVSSIIVTVYPNPQINILASQYSICSGSSANLYANSSLTGTSFLWNTGSSSPGITVSPLVSTVYTVIGTMTTGCYGSATVVLNVNPNPSFTINASSTELCQGESATLTASSSSGSVTYFWNVGGNTNPVIISPMTTTSYLVTATDNFGCSTTMGVNVVVHPTPLLTVTSSTTHLCYGSSATLNVNSNLPGTSFAWSNGSYNSSIQVNPLQTTIYTVMGTTSWGCQGSESYTLNVGAPVVVTMNSNNPEVCFGSTATLIAGGASSYAWSPAVTFGSTNGSIALVTPLHNTTYSVTGTDTYGCTGTSSYAVTVRPMPIVEFISDYNPSCDLANVKFTDLSFDEIVSWSWDFGDPISGMNNHSSLKDPTHLYNSPGSYDVTLEVVTRYGCSDLKVKHDMIFIYPTPNAVFTASPVVTSLPNGTVSFFNETTYWTNITWYFGDPASGTNNTSTLENPTHEYTTPGVYTVWMYATNELGCYDSLRVDITIQPPYDVFIPNTFTPNGDGHNDTFFPKGFGVENNNFEMYIFNRWGEEIFFSNNTNNAWDGTYRGNGEPVQTGVYPYILIAKSLSGLAQKYVGSVTLIK